MFSRGIIYAQSRQAYSTIEKFKSCFTRQKHTNNVLPLMSASNRQIKYNHQKTNYQDENKHSKYIRTFLLSASISASICVIFCLRRKNFFEPSSWIPSAFAASPFVKSKSDRFTAENSEVSVSGKIDPRKTYNFIADAAEKVSNAVVYISILDKHRRDFNGNPLAVSNGSGFIIESDGLIMTNAHVVGNRSRNSTIIVRLTNGTEFEGTIEEVDAITDLALVRINCKNLNSMDLGSSEDLRAGEFVVAMGSPLSLSNSVTSGVVSSVGRKSQELGLGGPEAQYIQTDAAITFGNSGGPLINLDGEVIGINSMKVTSGISFAIPVDYAKNFLERTKEKKEFMSKRKSMKVATGRRRYTGLVLCSLTANVMHELQQQDSTGLRIPSDIRHGLLVTNVDAGSPADYAGISYGDIITHINGHEMHWLREANVYLEGKSDLQMVVIRDGQRYSVVIAPKE